jgi:excisionase family DNA binding protein
MLTYVNSMKDRKSDSFYDHETGSRLMTAREVARYLKYHRYSVYRLIVQGHLRPRRKAGKTLLFLKEDLDRYKATNAWAARKANTGVLQEEIPPAPSQLTAKVSISLGFDLLPQEIETVTEFTWDQIPLIHGRTQERYGKRPSTIIVKGPEGGTWTVMYEPPTWLAKLRHGYQQLKKRSM